MKKRLKITITLYFLLSLLGFFVISNKGKIYEIDFPITNPNYTLSLNNFDGEVEILNEKQEDNTYKIKVKSVKPGKVEIGLNYEDSSTIDTLYVHKTMVITRNNYFGDSTRCEIIPITLVIFLAYCLYVLIIAYKNNLKQNLYQYKNVSYLGFIIFIGSSLLSTISSIFNYQGIYDTINKMIRSIIILGYILFPLAFILFVLVLIAIIKLIRKEGLSLRNLLGLFFSIFLCIVPFIPKGIYTLIQNSQVMDLHNLNGPGPYIFSFIESLTYLCLSYLECVLIGTIILAIKAATRKISYDKDYMLILGCKILEDGGLTPLLKGRVDKAIDFRNNQLASTGKDLIFVPSGGKGTDEKLSEGEAIEKYLLKKGISKDNIILENHSTNTYENIKLSNELIHNKEANIAFSTTNYHVFRAGLLADRQGLYREGIGAKTKSYFWINAFIREFIGTLYTERKKHWIFILNLTLTLIIMIGMTYIANNI